MGLRIAAAIFVAMFIIVLLSAVAPMQSQSKFWRMIHKIRARMDLAVYWFFNLCAISTLLFIAFMVVRGLGTAAFFGS